MLAQSPLVFKMPKMPIITLYIWLYTIIYKYCLFSLYYSCFLLFWVFNSQKNQHLQGFDIVFNTFRKSFQQSIVENSRKPYKIRKKRLLKTFLLKKALFYNAFHNFCGVYFESFQQLQLLKKWFSTLSTSFQQVFNSQKNQFP